MAVRGEDTKRLAREVRASFQFLQHRHELDPMEAPYHTPLPHPASINEGLCLQFNPLLPAWIYGRSPERRQ